MWFLVEATAFIISVIAISQGAWTLAIGCVLVWIIATIKERERRNGRG